MPFGMAEGFRQRGNARQVHAFRRGARHLFEIHEVVEIVQRLFEGHTLIPYPSGSSHTRRGADNRPAPQRAESPPRRGRKRPALSAMRLNTFRPGRALTSMIQGVPPASGTISSPTSPMGPSSDSIRPHAAKDASAASRRTFSRADRPYSASSRGSASSDRAPLLRLDVGAARLADAGDQAGQDTPRTAVLLHQQPQVEPRETPLARGFGRYLPAAPGSRATLRYPVPPVP